MTRFRTFLALGSMVAAAALALGVTATSVSARGGRATLGYTMDAYGGLHPMTIAGVTAPSETAASAANHTWSWKIARGMAEANNHTDGLVLDGWGGLHGWGTDTSSNAAPANPTNGPAWPGWDIARGLVLMSGSNNSGYILDGWGGVHPFGSAPAVTFSAYWRGWDIARAIELNPTATAGAGAFSCDVSGFVLDGWGGMHAFTDKGSVGDDPSCADPATINMHLTAYWSGWDIAHSFVIDNDNKAASSGYVMDGWGGLHAWCASTTTCTPPAAVTSGPYWKGWDIARSTESTGTGSGYILDGWGGVHGYGGAADPGVTGVTVGSDRFRDLDEN